MIQDLRLQNSPFWTTHPSFCSDVRMEKVYVYAPTDSRNTDGVDPDSVNGMVVRNCTFDTGESPLAAKGRGRENTVGGDHVVSQLVCGALVQTAQCGSSGTAIAYL